MVDGVHGLGADDEPVRIESFDVLVAGCHKWLGGPRGTGLVWSMKAWDHLRPTIPTFDASSYVAWLEGHAPEVHPPPGPTFTPGGYHAFEHRWALAEIRRVRFGTGLWVDEADVDAALAAIARL